MVGKNVKCGMNNGGFRGLCPSTAPQTPEEIFVWLEEVAEIVGGDEMKNIPLGAVGFYSYVEKLRVGLQAADGRRSCVQPVGITRDDVNESHRRMRQGDGDPLPDGRIPCGGRGHPQQLIPDG